MDTNLPDCNICDRTVCSHCPINIAVGEHHEINRKTTEWKVDLENFLWFNDVPAMAMKLCFMECDMCLSGNNCDVAFKYSNADAPTIMRRAALQQLEKINKQQFEAVDPNTWIYTVAPVNIQFPPCEDNPNYDCNMCIHITTCYKMYNPRTNEYKNIEVRDNKHS